MLAFAGRYFWWALGLFVVSLLIFFVSRSGPHLRGAGGGLSDITALISAVSTLIGAIVALLGAIDKLRGGAAKEPKPVIEDLPREAYRARDRGLRVGTRQNRIRADNRDDRYEWVEVLEFIGYDERTGDELWDTIDEFRRRRTR
jgi:hypothetical protein